MAQRVQRWIEVTPSQFTHEAEGLNLIRALLPANAPFRAWSNFEFRDGHGKWHEVDLLVLGRRRLHLVELKYYSGTLRGDDLTWRRDGHRAEDSPLKLARRKAQRLASKLQDELIRWAQETGHRIPDVRTVVPFVQESVFLHHPGIRCLLPPASRIDLFGLDGSESGTGLPGISERLLEPSTPPAVGRRQPRRHHRGADGADRDRAAPPARGRLLGHRRGSARGGRRLAGLASVPPGRHHRPGRIRFLVTPPGATATTRAKVRQVAEHEYRIMSRLPNDRLLRPRDMVDSDLGVGLVYPLDERFQRLDLWLADQSGHRPGCRAAVDAAPGRRGGGVRAREPGGAPRPDPARGLGPPPARRRAPGPGRRLAERGRSGRSGADRAVRQRCHRPDGCIRRGEPAHRISRA